MLKILRWITYHCINCNKVFQLGTSTLVGEPLKEELCCEFCQGGGVVKVWGNLSSIRKKKQKERR